MTQAIITKENGYKCAPNGVTVLHFAKGETVFGRVAELALQDAAAELFEPRTDTQAIKAAPETKRKGRK
jgi:hypothetical protein